MESILSYMAESLFCGALFYLLFYLLVSGKSSYSFQRLYILISSFCILLFPVISIPVNTSYIFSINLPEITVVAKGVGTGQIEKLSNAFNLSQLEIVYFSILTIFALLFIIQLAKILYLYIYGEKISAGGIIIISNNNVNSPFSFFNLIFIGKGIESLENGCVITHERAHIRRGHSFDIILISLINSIQWFNPFIYLLKRSLISVHEYQADKDVIMSGYTIKYYQNLVLSTQFGVSPFVANSLNNSLTIKRLKRMENLNEKRNRIIMFVSVILLTSALFFVVSCKTNNNKNKVLSSDTLKVTTQTASTTPDVVPPVPPPPVKPSSNEAPATPPPPPPPPPKVKAKTSESDVVEKFEAEEVPFTIVEVKPVFMGGDENTFTKWVSEKIVYPNEAKEKGIQGRVILQFLVKEDGSVANVKVVRGVDKALDMEAARVVLSSPKWSPGKQKGKNVAVRYTFPVIFKLQ